MLRGRVKRASILIEEDPMEPTTTVNAGPEYWHAPVPAAEAPREGFGMPEVHPAPEDEHRAFEDHDFGGSA